MEVRKSGCLSVSWSALFSCAGYSMDLSALNLDDDWWLGLFKSISILAILLTLLAAVFVQFFTARVTRAMKREISQSQQAAVPADQRTEELEGENLKLSIILEEERKARLDIQRRLQNRFLSNHEKTILLEAAKPFRGHKIGINSIGSDPEPELYARQFVAIMEEAGWKVDRGYGMPLGSVDYV